MLCAFPITTASPLLRLPCHVKLKTAKIFYSQKYFKAKIQACKVSNVAGALTLSFLLTKITMVTGWGLKGKLLFFGCDNGNDDEDEE